MSWHLMDLQTCHISSGIFYLTNENPTGGIEVRAELNPKCPSHALPAAIVKWQKLLTSFALRKTARLAVINITIFYVRSLPAELYLLRKSRKLAWLTWKWVIEKNVLEKEVT